MLSKKMTRSIIGGLLLAAMVFAGDVSAQSKKDQKKAKDLVSVSE